MTLLHRLNYGTFFANGSTAANGQPAVNLDKPRCVEAYRRCDTASMTSGIPRPRVVGAHFCTMGA